MSRQRLHHLCLRLKHASLSRHPRTLTFDTPMTRGVLSILQREGFLSAVLPGDDRAPFIDHRQSPSIVLSKGQLERVEMMKDMRRHLTRLHSMIGSDGSTTVDLTGVDLRFKDDPAAATVSNDDKLGVYAASYSASREARIWSLKHLLSTLPAVPAISTVYIPPALDTSTATSLKLSAEDLQHITPAKDRRLWIEIQYSAHQVPALTDMFLVSKSSRRVYTSIKELEQVQAGTRNNPWRGSDVGAVAIIKSDDGQVLTTKEALKRGVGGEVLCVAK
jgi:ribosomal protein S8